MASRERKRPEWRGRKRQGPEFRGFLRSLTRFQTRHRLATCRLVANNIDDYGLCTMASLKTTIERIRLTISSRDCAEVPDQFLLREYVRAQDESAFAGLVQRHGTMVLGVCLRILRHRQDAEDAFQATFLVL